MVRRFLWALTSRFTRAMGCSYLVGKWLFRRLCCRSAVQQLLDPLGVVGRHDGPSIQPARPLGRLVLQQVAAAGFLTHDLPGAGATESLRRSAVGLGLGHVSSVLRYQFGDGSVSSFGAACRVGPLASSAARARVFAPRCGASTIVMLRPSCLAVVSTNPKSATSAPSRCSTRKARSGRDGS